MVSIRSEPFAAGVTEERGAVGPGSLAVETFCLLFQAEHLRMGVTLMNNLGGDRDAGRLL